MTPARLTRREFGLLAVAVAAGACTRDRGPEPAPTSSPAPPPDVAVLDGARARTNELLDRYRASSGTAPLTVPLVPQLTAHLAALDAAIGALAGTTPNPASTGTPDPPASVAPSPTAVGLRLDRLAQAATATSRAHLADVRRAAEPASVVLLAELAASVGQHAVALGFRPSP